MSNDVDMSLGLHVQTGVLGEGTFGVVVKACDPASSGPELAIKLLPRGEFVSLAVLADLVGCPR